MTEATVVITIHRGLVQCVDHTGSPCRVIIRDYDVDGAEARRLAKDPEGRACFERVFEFPIDT